MPRVGCRGVRNKRIVVEESSVRLSMVTAEVVYKVDVDVPIKVRVIAKSRAAFNWRRSGLEDDLISHSKAQTSPKVTS